MERELPGCTTPVAMPVWNHVMPMRPREDAGVRDQPSSYLRQLVHEPIADQHQHLLLLLMVQWVCLSSYAKPLPLPTLAPLCQQQGHAQSEMPSLFCLVLVSR